MESWNHLNRQEKYCWRWSRFRYEWGFWEYDAERYRWNWQWCSNYVRGRWVW